MDTMDLGTAEYAAEPSAQHMHSKGRLVRQVSLFKEDRQIVEAAKVANDLVDYQQRIVDQAHLLLREFRSVLVTMHCGA